MQNLDFVKIFQIEEKISILNNYKNKKIYLKKHTRINNIPKIKIDRVFKIKKKLNF